jgi:outer membrane protein W
MKKSKILVALTGILFSFGINFNSSAQAVEQGNIIVDAYYGFPNLYTTVFKAAYANTGTELDLKVNGAGPLGLRGEYMVTEKIGLGLDLGFNNSKVSYNEVSQVYNSTTGNYDNVTYAYDFKTKKIGVLVCFNYHFLDNDKFDLFSTVGVGYANRSFSFTSTDPDYVSTDVKSLIPVGSKIGLGMRYFFTQNIGANLQLGFGQGGILNAGISAKF